MPTLTVPLLRRWVFPQPADPALTERLKRELRLPDALCALLVQRGFTEPEAAKVFLRPGPAQIHPPHLAGIGDAVLRLRRAIQAGETILVHGDYDVDGICATALYVRALTRMGARAEPFVPHRMEDGYDLSEAGVRAAKEVGAALILTGDCGIVAFEAVESARRAGIDVIVTDHHTPSSSALPAAVAVVNPNRPDCAYPNKFLSGTGVAYKVCCALAEETGFPVEQLACFLDLVAVATIADLVLLEGENRAFTRLGLRVLAQTPNAGLRALLESTGLAGRGEISAGQVGFVLAPRINAVGRMGEALRGVRLLLTDSPEEAASIATVLEQENRTRQEVEAATLREALAMLEREFDPEATRGVVLASAGWHPGVIGIVASRIVERIHRPTVMIALDPQSGEGKGSARSVPGLHLYETMHACSEHLTRFGGHRGAAGCSILASRVDAFRQAFDAEARARLSEEQLTPELRIDQVLPLAEANEELYALLRHAQPFGMGNPAPVFASRGVRLAGSPRTVGKGHLKLTLASGGRTLDAIGFAMAERLREPGLFSGEIDVAFRLEENTWNGRTQLQAKLLDVRAAGA